MTEAEWLMGIDPAPMLKFMRNAGRRKLILRRGVLPPALGRPV